MNNSSENNTGIIVLGGHIQGLGILRILGRKGIPGVIIDNSKKCIARHSSYCKYFFQIKDDELLVHLLNFGKQNLFKDYVIFPTNDYHVQLLSKQKKVLSQFFRIAIDNWEVVELFYDKTKSYRLAKHLEIPIPETFYPQSKESIKDLKISFPCIIKPAVMHSFYKQTKKKVLICYTLPELLNNYDVACRVIPPNEIIIQEVIPGDSTNQFSVGLLHINKIVYTYVIVCRKRQHPIDFGNATTYAETVNIPILKEYAAKILNYYNYNGVCEVEFKYDKRTDTYKFLEVNPRTWKWHSIANKSETPFLPLFYDYLTGKKISPIISFRDSSFKHFLTDFVVKITHLFKGNINILKEKKHQENAVWSWDDPFPWFFEKLYIIYFIRTR